MAIASSPEHSLQIPIEDRRVFRGNAGHGFHINQRPDVTFIALAAQRAATAADLGVGIWPRSLAFHGVDTLPVGHRPCTGAQRFNLTFRLAL